MRLKMLDKEKNVVDEQTIGRFTVRKFTPFARSRRPPLRQSHFGAPMPPPPEDGEVDRTCQCGTVAAYSLVNDQGRGIRVLRGSSDLRRCVFPTYINP